MKLTGKAFIQGRLVQAAVSAEGGIITAVEELSGRHGGDYILPGLVDVHTHGGFGADFTESSVEEICAALEQFARAGVTSVMATTSTAKKEELLAAAGSIGGLTGASVALPQEIADAIGDVGFWQSIPLWLVTLLGSLFITVLAFIMILTVYGRFFKIYMYAALSPVALASFAGEGTSHFGKAFLRSYVGVCMEGAVIVLACIIFSAFSSSGTPVVDSSASVVTQVWSYLGEVIFNLLVLVGLVKSADHIAKEMLGL